MNRSRRLPILVLTGVAVLLLLSPVLPVCATMFLPDGSTLTPEQISDFRFDTSGESSPGQLRFYYDYDCQSCQQALDYLRSCGKKNPGIDIGYFNLAYPKANNERFNDEKKRYNTTKLYYPALFIGDVAISGSSDIIRNTKPLAKQYLKLSSDLR